MKPSTRFLREPFRALAGLAILLATLPVPAMPAASVNSAAVLAEIARNGNEGAQVQLAGHYLNGTGGFAQNPQLAALWFERAAIQGNAYAELRLGDLYEAGLGVARNLKVAADWREKAANRGNTMAQLKLARMYRDGEGVDRNLRQADYWFDRAAVEGDDEARQELATLRREEAMTLRPGQRDQQALGFVHLLDYPEFRIEEVWHHRLPELQKLADDGDLEAQYVIGTHYLQGSYGKVRSVDLAVSWFKRAAAGGDRRAARALARIYGQGGDGLPADPQLAQYWAARAAALSQ